MQHTFKLEDIEANEYIQLTSNNSNSWWQMRKRNEINKMQGKNMLLWHVKKCNT